MNIQALKKSTKKEIYWASDKEFDFIRLLFACMKIGWAFQAEIVLSLSWRGWSGKQQTAEFYVPGNVERPRIVIKIPFLSISLHENSIPKKYRPTFILFSNAISM